MNNVLNVGDLVVLNSGGPEMTVEGSLNGSIEESLTVNCIWMQYGSVSRDTFRREVLRKVGNQNDSGLFQGEQTGSKAFPAGKEEKEDQEIAKIIVLDLIDQNSELTIGNIGAIAQYMLDIKDSIRNHKHSLPVSSTFNKEDLVLLVNSMEITPLTAQ